MPPALEGVLTGEAQPRIRFEGVRPDGCGATVAKPWPNCVTELEANRGRYTDLPFMGKTIKKGGPHGDAMHTDTLLSVRLFYLVLYTLLVQQSLGPQNVNLISFKRNRCCKLDPCYPRRPLGTSSLASTCFSQLPINGCQRDFDRQLRQ